MIDTVETSALAQQHGHRNERIHGCIDTHAQFTQQIYVHYYNTYKYTHILGGRKIESERETSNSPNSA